jgi:V8-like Glu-specific endopeptidase
MQFILPFLIFIMAEVSSPQNGTKIEHGDSAIIAPQILRISDNWWSAKRDSNYASYKDFPAVGYFEAVDMLGPMATGFVLQKGIVITCYHVYNNVLKGCNGLSINLPGQDKVLEVELIDTIRTQDIAIYKIKDSVRLNGFNIGEFHKIELRDTVQYVGGYFADSVFVGRAFVIERGERMSLEGDFGVLMALGVGWPGLSGSPLLDKDGKVIGIVTGGMGSEESEDDRRENSIVLRANSIASVKDIINNLLK